MGSFLWPFSKKGQRSSPPVNLAYETPGYFGSLDPIPPYMAEYIAIFAPRKRGLPHTIVFSRTQASARSMENT